MRERATWAAASQGRARCSIACTSPAAQLRVCVGSCVCVCVRVRVRVPVRVRVRACVCVRACVRGGGHGDPSYTRACRLVRAQATRPTRRTDSDRLPPCVPVCVTSDSDRPPPEARGRLLDHHPRHAPLPAHAPAPPAPAGVQAARARGGGPGREQGRPGGVEGLCAYVFVFVCVCARVACRVVSWRGGAGRGGAGRGGQARGRTARVEPTPRQPDMTRI